MATILSAATAIGAGGTISMSSGFRSFQAYGATSSGAGAATIEIQVSNDTTNWLVLGTITLTLATTVSNDGLSAISGWPYCRANVSALSGTGASVNVTVN